MDTAKPKALTPDDIRKINSILARGRSAEVKPAPNGVRVFQIKREEEK